MPLRSLILLLLLLSACAGSDDRPITWGEEGLPEKAIWDKATVQAAYLKGTVWETDFYYFNPYLYFETDSTGAAQDGNPYTNDEALDTSLKEINVFVDSLQWQHQYTDSLGFENHFSYRLSDSVLTLRYRPTVDAPGGRTETYFFAQG